MKHLFTICIILIGMILMGQENSLLLKNVDEKWINSGSFIRSWNYSYDEGNHYLTTCNYIVNDIDGSAILTFEKDTLIRSEGKGQYTDIQIWKYYNDSIEEYEVYGTGDTSRRVVYYLDNLGQILEAKYDFIGSWYYYWSEGNLTEVRNEEDELVQLYTYDPHYLNPFYDSYKYRKIHYMASKNILKTHWAFSKDTITWVVDEAIGEYPLLMSSSWLRRTFTYEDITEVPEHNIQPIDIISISYFNILGQQIDRPMKGFYIERKLTKKGIISTKHYIP